MSAYASCDEPVFSPPPDVEMTCDRVAIVNKGELQRVGKLKDILSETTKGVSVRIGNLNPEQVENIAKEFSDSVISEANAQIDFDDVDEANMLVSKLTASGASLEMFEPHRDDLETIFVRSLEQTEEPQ